jgi:hypothetical protein
MAAVFLDTEDDSNKMNGLIIDDGAALSRVLQQLVGRPPFIFELERDDGSELVVGIGDSIGCVEFSAAAGPVPYEMATSPGARIIGEDVEFLTGGTLTPISARYCIPRALVLRIAEYFVETGRKLAEVAWEPI